MHRIVAKTDLAADVVRLDVEAPRIATKHRAGQFVILRVFEHSERIPLTVADKDVAAGTISLVVQGIGKSTRDMCILKAGDSILDVVGPLGRPTHIENFGHAVCVAGGIGAAPMLPIAAALKQAGNRVTTILGARTKKLYILTDAVERASDETRYCTDDGSFGRHGFVTAELGALIQEGRKIDYVIAIGPAIMMKAVCDLTRSFNLLTYVSLNSIMVDGTGMCGACRVTVGGKTRFVCVEGPEFNGHEVDFNELFVRQGMYRSEEKAALEHSHACGGSCR